MQHINAASGEINPLAVSMTDSSKTDIIGIENGDTVKTA